MRPWHKVLFGLGSHWLLIYLPVFLGFIFTLVVTSPKGPEASPAFVGGIVALIFVHVLSILFMLATLGVFIAYVIKHPRFNSNEKLMWALLLAFAGAIAAPVFFWLCFRKHPIGEPFFGESA